MRAKWLLIGLAMLLLCNVRAISQTHYLPSDLIFPVEDLQGNQTMLMRVDAHTMSAVAFYSDPSTIISLQVLKWSPDGQKLAIARRIDNINAQVCVLKRSGVLLTCMQSPAAFGTNSFFESVFDSVRWSEDGRYLYFVSQQYNSSTPTPIQLIEADAVTGETLRVVYEKLGTYASLTFIWNADLSKIILGSINGYNQSTPLELLTFTQTTQPPVLNDLTLTITSRDQLMYLCGQASPKGTFFSLIEGDKTSLVGNAIVVFDTKGQVIDRIDTLFGVSKIKVICPAWSWDEQNLFFGAYVEDEYLGVIRHSLIDGRTIRYEIVPEMLSENWSGISSPYAISYDNSWLAGRQYVYRDSPTWQVAVLGPNGEYHTFLGNWRSAGFPLWVPPLDE